MAAPMTAPSGMLDEVATADWDAASVACGTSDDDGTVSVVRCVVGGVDVGIGPVSGGGDNVGSTLLAAVSNTRLDDIGERRN
jgi:hypothetical protein